MFMRKLGFYLTYIAVEMEAVAILQLRPMNTDLDRRHLGAPCEMVIGPYHGDDKPTMNITACTRVGFPTLGGNASG